ncbi:hypothetical protein D9M73_287360 [compost metagenome]
MTAGAGLAAKVFSKRCSALAQSVTSSMISTSDSGSPRLSASTRLRTRCTQVRSSLVTSTSTSLKVSPRANRLIG